jgi:LacI family transcriptional regulator
LGVKSLYRNQVKIQVDIQITCFDESEAFHLLPYSVPYIKQPIELMAKESTRLLIDQIEERSKEIETDFIEAELICK